jgi:hypothetical protein
LYRGGQFGTDYNVLTVSIQAKNSGNFNEVLKSLPDKYLENTKSVLDRADKTGENPVTAD